MKTKALLFQFIVLFLMTQPLKAQSAFKLNENAEKLLTSDPEKAKELLKKALGQNPDKTLKEKINLNNAIIDRVQGDFKKAIKQSTAIAAQTTSEAIKASAYNNIGSSYNRLGNKEKALKFYLSALHIYEKSKNARDAATVENNIGLLYQNMEDFETALTYHKNALKKFTQLKDQKGLAMTYNLMGIVLANQGNFEDALKHFKKTYALEVKEKNRVGISESLNNIGGIYYYLNNMDSALSYFNRSLAIDKSNQDFANLADGYNNLAEVHLSSGNVKKVASYLDSSIYYAQKTNYHQAYVLALELYAHLYEQEKNLPQVIAFQKRILEVKDSIATVSNRANINELEKKYQVKKKEAALQEEKLKNKNKTLLMFVLLGAVLMLITIIVFIIQRKKMHLQQATIQNLKNLDAERTRIARDLHDNLGAELTLISSKIDVKAYNTTNENEKRELEEIREISSTANNVLRDTIWSIHKHELTAEELKTKTLDFISRININPKVEISVIVETPQTYSPAIALHLFRIIQEATNNAIKYASCTELSVILASQSLRIIDNGIGFHPERVTPGYGLINMQARANEMNAQLTIKSSSENGTTIQLDL